MANITDTIFILRIITALFVLCELGINAYIVYWADGHYYEDPYGDWGVRHDTPSQIAFLLFASAWSILALIYLSLAPTYLIRGGGSTAHIRRNSIHRYAMLALDVITTIFWLAGWITLTKLIGGPTDCGGFCAAIQAGVAFAAATWAAFNACAFIQMWQLWKRWRMNNDKINGVHNAQSGDVEIS